MLFQKIANYKLMPLAHKEKNYPDMIKINITKLFI